MRRSQGKSPSLLDHLVGELSPQGRLSRSGFWLRHVTLLPLALCVATVPAQRTGPLLSGLSAALLLALLLSIWGRRLHDRGRSAWWLLISAVPVLGALFLWVECGFRGTVPSAARFGPVDDPDYLIVKSSTSPHRSS